MPDKFYNPYNFVRPLKKPQEGHILGHCPPPPHDRYTGLSGRITCTLTNKTPLFVSEGEPFNKEGDHPHYHFFNVDGTDIIPGTSLRGPIRSVFEAATNSSFGAFTFKDEPLFYRKPPEYALRLVPARVEKSTNSASGYKLRLLTDECTLTIGRRNPNTFYGAWIPAYQNRNILNKERYTYDQNGRRHDRHKHMLDNDELILDDPPLDSLNGSLCYAAIINTSQLPNAQRKGYPHLQANFVHTDKQKVAEWVNRQNNRRDYEISAGYVLHTGLNADVKQYERFFCISENDSERLVDIDKDLIRRYNHLMEDYYNRRESIENSLDSQSNEGRKGLKPSVFIKKLHQLEEGTLVYADLSGTSNDPKVKAIYPVSISRAMYERTVRDVIEEHHPHLLPPTDINKLCLASRFFGWVSQDADSTDRSKEVAYKGRVRFSHATLQAGEKYESPMTLAILGSPHPTSLEFYLESGISITPNTDGSAHGYDEQNAKIRGRKFYRHHKKFNADEATTTDKSNQNRTIHGAYGEGSIWTFTIDFENLQPIELGALLWTLDLACDGKRGYHRIGYGKPLGLGSVQIDIASLEVYNPKQRYSVEPSASYHLEADDLASVKAKMINEFTSGMAQVYSRDFEQLPNIVDLMALLTDPQHDYPIHYPRLQNEVEGFKWFMDNRTGKKVRLPDAENDEGLPYRSN